MGMTSNAADVMQAPAHDVSGDDAPLYRGPRLNYACARAFAGFVDMLIVCCFAWVVRAILSFTGAIEASWWTDGAAFWMYVQVATFMWRWAAEIRGEQTMGRSWMGIQVHFPQEQSRVPHAVRALIHCCWWLVPILCWVIFERFNGSWPENPFDDLWVLMFLMVLFSRSGAHLFDWLAKARVVRIP